MSDQTNQPEQTPAELRQSILNQLDESKKIIGELNEEELETVSGGLGLAGLRKLGEGMKSVWHRTEGARRTGGTMVNGAVIATTLMPSTPTTPDSPTSPTTNS